MNLLYHAIKDNKTTGFTLIELLVVVLIIGVVSSVMLITFVPQSSETQVSVGNTVLVALREARASARANQQIVGIHINEDGQLLFSVYRPPAGGQSNRPVYATPESWNYTKQLDVKVVAAIDYRDELRWRDTPQQLQIRQTTSVVTEAGDNEDSQAPSLPTIVIMPTGEVVPTGALDILDTDGIQVDTSIMWEKSEFTLQDP